MDANRTRIHPASHTHPASHIEKTTTPQIRIISLDREPHLWQIATFQVGKRHYRYTTNAHGQRLEVSNGAAWQLLAIGDCKQAIKIVRGGLCG